jgi:tetratricopeptide (TPR) repeat protein/TolB-like protein
MRIGKIPTLYFWTAVLTVGTGGAPALPAQSHLVLPRIAVLPLEHAVGNAAAPDLGFGLAAEVTHWLFYVPGIVVRPMNASADSGREPEDLERLARELDVNYLLTGTLRGSATHYEVEYRLHRWTGGAEVIPVRVSVPAEELSHLPFRTAEAVVETLPIQKDSVKSRFFKGMLPSSSSYLVFLKALSSTPKTDEEKEQRLRALETVAQQSDYPPMVALLGRLYLDRAGEIGGRGPYYPLAEETLKRAFELDPDFPPARELLASLFAKRGRSERTVALMQEGLVGHPTYPGFHKTLGYVLRYGGLMDESIGAYRRAQELDGSLTNLVSTQDQITKSFIYRGDYEKALASHRKMLKTLERMRRGPNEKQIFYKGVIHLYAGEKAQAVECFQRAAHLEPHSVWTTFGQAYQGMADGDRERVTDIMERLEQRIVVDGERHYRLVHFCAFLGRKDAALEHLQTSIKSGFFNSPYIRNDPLLASLQDLPRFGELLRTAEERHLAFRELILEQ